MNDIIFIIRLNPLSLIHHLYYFRNVNILRGTNNAVRS